MITRPFAVKYMRSTKDKRKAFKINKINKAFYKELFRRARKGSEMTDEELQNFQEDLYQIIEEK